MEKRADMAGLGKYCMGGYGRIGVYRVKDEVKNIVQIDRPLQRNVLAPL